MLHCSGNCALLLNVDGVAFRYVGELNRDEATRMLSNLPNGTFLIRVSNTAGRRGEHALSIRFDYLFAYLLIIPPPTIGGKGSMFLGRPSVR